MNISDKIECTPEETGYDSTRLVTLNNHFQRLVDEKLIHGASYCIAHKGKVIAAGSIGYGSAIDHNVKMCDNAVFEIASITKIFTATAIMKLVEDGLIRLDTPVGEILPQMSAAPFDKITLMHLLTHSSGLYPDMGCFPEEFPKCQWQLIEEAASHLSKEELKDFDWVKASLGGGLRVPVGSQWQYCTFGFCLLGEVISKVSGMFAHDYIEKNICQPLGMNDTSFTLSQDMAKRMYIDGENSEKFVKDVIDGKRSGYDDVGTIWEKIPSTGGGLCSTAYDLVKYGNAMLYGGRFNGARILGRKAVDKMRTIQLHNVPDYCWGADTPDRLYGVGFDMRQGPAYTYSEGTYMHEGAGACSLDIDPKEELVAAWHVPFAIDDWSAIPLYNTQNVIWSGLI